MKWITLTAFLLESWYSKGLKAKLEAVNGRIGELLQGRSELDQLVASQHSAGLESFDFQAAYCFPDARAERARLLQVELGIRGDLPPLFDEIKSELAKQNHVAYRRHEKAQQEIRDALVGIGYVDGSPFKRVIGRIEPGWILCHPKVHAARQHLENLRRQQNDNSGKLQNAGALGTLEQLLAQERDRATALS